MVPQPGASHRENHRAGPEWGHGSLVQPPCLPGDTGARERTLSLPPLSSSLITGLKILIKKLLFCFITKAMHAHCRKTRKYSQARIRKTYPAIQEGPSVAFVCVLLGIFSISTHTNIVTPPIFFNQNRIVSDTWFCLLPLNCV